MFLRKSFLKIIITSYTTIYPIHDFLAISINYSISLYMLYIFAQFLKSQSFKDRSLRVIESQARRLPSIFASERGWVVDVIKVVVGGGARA